MEQKMPLKLSITFFNFYRDQNFCRVGDTYDNMARNKPNCKIHKTNHSSEGNEFSKRKNA